MLLTALLLPALLLPALLLAPLSSALPPPASSAGVHLVRSAFTPAECSSIVSLLKLRPREQDVRVDKSVSRVNYFDASPGRLSPGPYDWIYERVLAHFPKTPSPPPAAAAFPPLVDFVLLHEFAGSPAAPGFFDWHVDTSPNDGTGRTVNVNVMLSGPGDYEGGGLWVGERDVRPSRGDLYYYPANFPHKVGDVTGGTRHTLVLAVKSDDGERARSGYWERGRRNLDRLCFEGGEREPWEERRRLDVPPKWHMLRGEAALAAGRGGEADEAFGDMYAASGEAGEYAKTMDGEGRELAGRGEVEESLGFFRMAARIEPGNEVYRSHVEQVEKKLGLVD